MNIALGGIPGRAAAMLLASIALTACSGQLVPPAEIDGENKVSAIKPVEVSEDRTYAAPQQPVAEATETVDYLNTPNLAGIESKPAEAMPKIDEISSENAATIPEGGVRIDDQLGVETPVSLAEEEASTIAEGNTAQPLVDGIGTDNPMQINQPSEEMAPSISLEAARAAEEITPPSRRRTNEAETRVAFVPRFSDPMQIPESFGGLTAADRACRAELKTLGVQFRELDPISDGPSCGIAHPIEVSGLAGGIRIKPAAKVNCNITRNFAKWVKFELVPSARYRYFSGIKTIYQMSSYSCRKMNSKSSNPWSEHAKGNAIDIGKFVLTSGKEIDVRKKGFFEFREKGLLKAVRSDSCKYFNTVLGPGSDPHHKDHFHFDLRTRKSGYRHCD